MRVLVIEDEVHLAESIRQGLTVEGFTVDVVHDGVDGLWSATEHRYDAIVLDIMLPKLNGFACSSSCGPERCGRRCSC